MISILTGDIINSRNYNPQEWQTALKTILNKFGNEPTQWEIYRGDSFQTEVDVLKAFEAALLIKASLKQLKGIDVRIAIGIGDKSYNAGKITASNGSAFINSGECFERLKKQKMALKSPSSEINEEMNLYIKLALLNLNKLSEKNAQLFITKFENPLLNQYEIGELLGVEQSTISQRLRTIGFNEIKEINKRYMKLIKKI